MRTTAEVRKSEKSRGQEIRHVVCAIDSNMVYGIAVLLSSLKSTANKSFKVTIGYLGDRLLQQDRAFLAGVTEELDIAMGFLPLPDREIFISQGHISPTTFAKFLLGDEYPTPHLWIDADTIALPGWDQLFEEIGACSISEGLVVAQRGSSASNRLSKPSDLPFNAGVLGWPEGPRLDWEAPLSRLDRVDTQEQFLFNQLYASTARRVSEKFNLLTYRIDSLDLDDMPYIIHYAGAHKPWHLSRDLSQPCMDYRCPWSAWFAAEEKLFDRLRDTSLVGELKSRQDQALITGRVKLRRDHSGYNFLRLLAALGPLAPIVVNLLTVLKQWIPRGTHPIH